MKIGIDIDATMNNAYYAELEYCKILCDIYKHKYIFDPTKAKLKDQFQLTDFLNNLFMKIYFPQIVKYASLLPGFTDALNDLISDGHEVVCITSRRSEYKSLKTSYNGVKMMRDTFSWFKQNKLPFNRDNVYFSIGNKGAFCKVIGVDVLIDDHPNQISSCIEHGITCFYPVYQYNKLMCDGNDFAKPFNSWNEFSEIFNK